MEGDSFVPCAYSALPAKAGLIQVCCPDDPKSATPTIIATIHTGNIRQYANTHVSSWKSHCSSVELEYLVALDSEAEHKNELL